jgi:hypothetical protein
MRPRLFLDLMDRVHHDAVLGLVGVAFHPEFASNGRFFVSYNCDSYSRRLVVPAGAAMLPPETNPGRVGSSLLLPSSLPKVVVSIPRYCSDLDGMYIINKFLKG